MKRLFPEMNIIGYFKLIKYFKTCYSFVNAMQIQNKKTCIMDATLNSDFSICN